MTSRQIMQGHFGRSNGNGPWHLLTADDQAALCGVKRFGVHYVSAVSPRDVCSICRRNRNREDCRG